MFFVLLAGLIWSFGPLVVRNMDNAELVPWQYSLIRGSAIFIILNLYLFLTEGSKFINNYNKNGLIRAKSGSFDLMRKIAYKLFSSLTVVCTPY